MKQWILSEENYAGQMQGTVLPYLAARRRECPLARAPGQVLYCTHYRADDAAGVAILSHGFTESEEKYQELIYYFLRCRYHVYMAEHCGHGRSYRLTEKDLSLVHVDDYHRYVDDLLAVADRARAENPGLPLYLYGHSMGGGIAAAALAARPELFRRAVLSSPMIRPLTGGVPWWAAKAMAAVLCAVGQQYRYVPGGHAYDGQETFADSCGVSQARFAWYKQRRSAEPLFQTNGASCGWFRAAARLNHDLQATAWQQIKTPVLLFQAGLDTTVSNEEQDRFIEKLRTAGGESNARLVVIPEAKHEIFNSTEIILERYWPQVFAFFAEEA